jgi:hypothetical protein
LTDLHETEGQGGHQFLCATGRGWLSQLADD